MKHSTKMPNFITRLNLAQITQENKKKQKQKQKTKQNKNLSTESKKNISQIYSQG